jgi:hypothetical protein
MSVATDFVPLVHIPERARSWDRGWDTRPDAEVIELFRPSEDTVAPPLRLTRRGAAVLALLTALAALAVVGLAWISAPGTSAARAGGPATVTVHDGDTLWSIASRVAPDRDPRDEVTRLQRLNHLDGVQLAAGQVLRTS